MVEALGCQRVDQTVGSLIKWLDFTFMHDDPHIKRVLKRYRKEEKLSDASMDVTALGLAELLRACGSDDADYLTAPKELGDFAVAHLARVMGIEFDRGQFDYFLHSYVRLGGDRVENRRRNCSHQFENFL